MDALRTLLFPEKPILYPLQPAKTKAVDVNNGKMDIDLSSFAQEKYVFIWPLIVKAFHLQQIPYHCNS